MSKRVRWHKSAGSALQLYQDIFEIVRVMGRKMKRATFLFKSFKFSHNHCCTTWHTTKTLSVVKTCAAHSTTENQTRVGIWSWVRFGSSGPAQHWMHFHRRMLTHMFTQRRGQPQKIFIFVFFAGGGVNKIAVRSASNNHKKVYAHTAPSCSSHPRRTPSSKRSVLDSIDITLPETHSQSFTFV